MCELSKEELDGYFKVKEFRSMSVIDYIKWKHDKENDIKELLDKRESDTIRCR